MLVKKFGLNDADEIPLHTYAEAGRLDAFTIHAGDSSGVLKGTRLDQVLELDAGNLQFKPKTLTRANQQDELTLVAQPPVSQSSASQSSVSQPASTAAALQAGAPIDFHVTLKDGRVTELKSTVESPRPSVSVVSKSVQYDPSSPVPIVKLGDENALPQDARLNFFLKTQAPESFPPTEKIEVATADESFRVSLSFKDGNLTLQDSKTVFAVLDPMKLLGPSAFGPLKFRPVTAEGVEGDWQPLVELVRLPALKGVHCTAVREAVRETVRESGKESAREKQCTLIGDKLFLLDSVSADPDFANSVTIPDGFTETTLPIPPLKAKTLYLKLRDDPTTVDTAVLPTLPAVP